jgi:hypothetical protein
MLLCHRNNQVYLRLKLGSKPDSENNKGPNSLLEPLLFRWYFLWEGLGKLQDEVSSGCEKISLNQKGILPFAMKAHHVIGIYLTFADLG